MPLSIALVAKVLGQVRSIRLAKLTQRRVIPPVLSIFGAAQRAAQRVPQEVSQVALQEAAQMMRQLEPEREPGNYPEIASATQAPV